jgi:hypothetical protein
MWLILWITNDGKLIIYKLMWKTCDFNFLLKYRNFSGHLE